MDGVSTEKKKIIYVITKASWGGAGRYVYDLATSLPRDEFDVTVIAGGEGLLTQKLRENKINTVELPFLERDLNPTSDLEVLKSLKQYFKESNPDIIHLNSSKVGGLGAVAGRLAGVPKIVFTAHGWAFNEDRSFFWRFFAYVASWLTAIFCHLVITISYKEEKDALTFPFVSGKKIQMIYVGIGKKDFLPRDEARKYIQGINKKTPHPNVPWIGSIGELHKNKGHIVALEMCKLLLESGKDFFYFIIGEGEERERLEKYIAEHKLSENVALLGAIPSPSTGSTLLKAFDVFLFPSLKEGLPYVLLEAGLADSAVIATTVGGIPEIIEHNHGGLLTDRKKPLKLMELMHEVMFDERIQSEMSRNLKENILEKFTKEKMIQETVNVYRN